LSELTGEWPVFAPTTQGLYARQWRMPSSLLTRGLGRPIRDQVYTERESDPTTLQALELVNGEILTHMLARGAQRMLGELPPAPENLSGATASAKCHDAYRDPAEEPAQIGRMVCPPVSHKTRMSSDWETRCYPVRQENDVVFCQHESEET